MTIRHTPGFRTHILNQIKGFASSRQTGIFLNSCFAHCQSERQDTWYANNSPKIGNKVCTKTIPYSAFQFVSWKLIKILACFLVLFRTSYMSRCCDLQGIAKSVGDWYFDRANVKSIDCPYPCDTTCHNLQFHWTIMCSPLTFFLLHIVISSPIYIEKIRLLSLLKRKKKGFLPIILRSHVL